MAADVKLSLGPSYLEGIVELRKLVIEARKKDAKRLFEVEFEDEAYPNLDVSVFVKAKDLYLRAFKNGLGIFAFSDCSSEDAKKLGCIASLPVKTDYHELGAWKVGNKITRWQAPKSIGVLAHWAPKSKGKADFLDTEKAAFACLCFLVSESARFHSISNLLGQCFADDTNLHELELSKWKHVVTNWSALTGKKDKDIAVPWEA